MSSLSELAGQSLPSRPCLIRDWEAVKGICKGMGKIDRLIVLLRHWEGMAWGDIAATLSMSESAVTVRNSRIIQNLAG